MSFVHKVKRRKLTRNISHMLLAFSDEIETLRATDPKADLGSIYQNYDAEICWRKIYSLHHCGSN
jgi:hypothetical protein